MKYSKSSEAPPQTDELYEVPIFATLCWASSFHDSPYLLCRENPSRSCYAERSVGRYDAQSKHPEVSVLALAGPSTSPRYGCGFAQGDIDKGIAECGGRACSHILTQLHHAFGLNRSSRSGCSAQLPLSQLISRCMRHNAPSCSGCITGTLRA